MKTKRKDRKWHEEGEMCLVPYSQSPHGNAVARVGHVSETNGEAIYYCRLVCYPICFPVADKDIKLIPKRDTLDALLARDRAEASIAEVAGMMIG